MEIMEIKNPEDCTVLEFSLTLFCILRDPESFAHAGIVFVGSQLFWRKDCNSISMATSRHFFLTGRFDIPRSANQQIGVASLKVKA